MSPADNHPAVNARVTAAAGPLPRRDAKRLAPLTFEEAERLAMQYVGVYVDKRLNRTPMCDPCAENNRSPSRC